MVIEVARVFAAAAALGLAVAAARADALGLAGPVPPLPADPQAAAVIDRTIPAAANLKNVRFMSGVSYFADLGRWDLRC
ncbi:MAG: hypothetical protein M3O64_04285 [Chloroflexota bacterium]|nr:hypothetical protein [Chloroflexota bacterium]